MINTAQKTPRFSERWNDRTASTESLLHLGSEHFGVAPIKFEITHSSNEVRSHYIGVRSAAADEIIGTPVNHSNGGGSFSREQARIAGIAETVERYSAAYIPRTGLRTCSYNNLNGPALHPSDFALFAPHQYEQPAFPYIPFTAETVTTWTQGLSLRTGLPTYVPAQLVYLNRHLDPDSRIGYATSNGLACGPDYTEAAISALFECAERDAVMITWNAGLAMPRIDLNSNLWVRKIIRRHFKPTWMNFAALDLTPINGIPTSLAVVWSNNPETQLLSVGAASRSTLAEACVEALLEAFHCTAYCRSLIRDNGSIDTSDNLDKKVVSLEDHVRFYGSDEHAKLAEFLLGSSQQIDLQSTPNLDHSSPRQLLEELVRTLDGDIDCTIVDATSPDLQELDLAVVKAVCPQFITLGVGWRDRYIGGDRILDVPQKIGLSDHQLAYSELTPYPHPFP